MLLKLATYLKTIMEITINLVTPRRRIQSQEDPRRKSEAPRAPRKAKKKMTDYERIKASCLQRGELWEDPDFPATQASVFYHQIPPFQFEWKRPKDIYNMPSFMMPNATNFDVIPGRMGDRWLVSCLGVLYLSKGLFYRVVPADQRFDDPYAGVFRFRLWWCGQWVEVLVDDRLPTVNGKLAFLQTAFSEQLWPALLEKAYAKLHGSYEALKYGSLLDGLADLTGGITESVPIVGVRFASVKMLQQLLNTTGIVTAAIHTPNARVKNEKVNGIDVGLNYRIFALEKVDTQSSTIFLVKLGRPLPFGEQEISCMVLDAALWLSIPIHERQKLITPNPEETGCFWMLYSDFEQVFTHIEAVHLDSETSRDEPSLANKNTWHMQMYQGNWRKGVSAGGCRNNADFFHMNPQVLLVLDETDEVIISLNQHSIMEPKVIGFSAYSLTKPLTETAPATYFKKHKTIINSHYTNSRQVSQRCRFERGSYLVLPTTFEPRDEAGFTLRIFSSKNMRLRVLDKAPSMIRSALVKAPLSTEAKSFLQYEAVFLQLADEHRTVNAFELHELLEACLPNDYIKSCATIEVCRQVVLALDSSGNGRITLNDFKDLMCSLKHWQGIFKIHSREKMGVLRAERLREALKDVGFVLPEHAMFLLVLRFMRKDGMLRFGDFVSAVLHLQVAFRIYEAKDPTKSGAIKLSLSEWLTCSLMC